MRLSVPAAVLAGLLAGCTLVDQNTFNPNAGAAPVIPPAPTPAAAVPVPSGPLPLLTIAPTAKPADYAGPLHKAVADARARKPTVAFDVVEMESPDAPPDTVLGAAAAAVARAISSDGIPPTRIRLDARPDASAAPKEVRVYVH